MNCSGYEQFRSYPFSFVVISLFPHYFRIISAISANAILICRLFYFILSLHQFSGEAMKNVAAFRANPEDGGRLSRQQGNNEATTL